jgi:hypothetical protein
MNKQSIFTQMQEDAIRAIVVSELQKMKKQIDIEISSDIKKCEEKIAADNRKLEEKIAAEKAKSEKMQLAIVKKSDETNREMIVAVGQQVTNLTFKRVMDEINTKVVPKINEVAQYVSYQMQDTTELVTDYRRAVYDQSNASNRKLLTNGDTRHVLSEHVQTVFHEDD